MFSIAPGLSEITLVRALNVRALYLVMALVAMLQLVLHGKLTFHQVSPQEYQCCQQYNKQICLAQY